VSQIIYPQVRKIKDIFKEGKMKMSPSYVEGDRSELDDLDPLKVMTYYLAVNPMDLFSD
jgi:hypothetical protein